MYTQQRIGPTFIINKYLCVYAHDAALRTWQLLQPLQQPSRYCDESENVQVENISRAPRGDTPVQKEKARDKGARQEQDIW